MADVSTVSPEVSESSERNKAACDALRSDASLESPVAPTTDTSSEHLPALSLEDCSAADPMLQAKALALKEYLHPGHVFGIGILPENGIEFTDVQNIFRSMSPAQMQDFESAYNNLPDTDDLSTALGRLNDPVKEATIHALMGRTEGETNWGGYISVALEAANSGDQNGGGELMRAIFSTMDKAEIDAAGTQWANDHGGQTLEDAIKASGLSETDKGLYQSIYMGGADNRDTAVTVQAAKDYISSLDNGYPSDIPRDEWLRRFGDIVSGDTNATSALLEDPNFVAQYHRVFDGTLLAEGYLNEGRISLTDVISQNRTVIAKLMQGEASEDFVESALRNATSEERVDFIAGRALVQSGAELTTTEDQRKADYYNNMMRTFQEAGGTELAAVWEDVLTHGKKTLVSEVAMIDSDFEKSQPELMHMIESMSEEDWKLIHSADGTQTPELTALIDTIGKVAPEFETEAVARLREMAEAATYSDAKAGNSSFDEIIARNSDAFSAPNAADVLEAVKNMTDADREKYFSNEEYRASVDAVIFPNHQIMKSFIDNPVAQAQMLMVQSMLGQIKEDGKAPEMGVVENFAQKVINGEINSSNQLATLEAVATDPSVQQLLKNYLPMYNEQMMPANSFEEHLDGYDARTTSLTQLLMSLDPDGHKANFGALVNGGKISEATQMVGDLAPVPGFSTLADETTNRFSPEDPRFEVAQNVLDQNGKAEPEDIAQMYLLGMDSHANGGESYNYRDVLTMLDAAGPEGRTQFYQSMKDKYQVDFVEAFKSRVASENLEGGYKSIFDNAVAQGFNLTTADEVALAALDDNGGYREFESALSAMSFDERDQMKAEFAAKGYGDFDSEFLGLIGSNTAELEKYGALISSFEEDPSSKFIQRLLESKDDLSGWDLDGTNEELVRSVLTNRDVLAKYAAARESLPPEVLAQIDQMYVDAVNDNRTSKENVAAKVNAAVDGILLVAAVASMLPSGGTSAVAFGALTAASRASLIDAVKGDGIMTEDERQANFNRAMLEAGLFLGPDAAIQAFQGVKALAQNPAIRDLIIAGADMPEVATVTNKAAAVISRPTAEQLAAIRRVDDVVPEQVVPAIKQPTAEELAAIRNVDAATPEEVVATVKQPTPEELAAIRNVDNAAPEEVVATVKQPTPEELAAIRNVDAATPEEVVATVKQPTPEELAAIRNVPDELVIPRGTIFPTTAAEILEAQPQAEQTDFEPPTPNDALIAMATVKRGEGPWQTAERILAAAGGGYDVMEVRALTNAIKAIYAADSNNPDISGLKVNHQFITDANFEQLVNSVSNEDVKAALMGFAA